MKREPLNERRESDIIQLTWNDQTFFIGIGYYDDGRPGEVFCDTGKTHAAIQQLVKDACILISIALQQGVEPGVLAKSVARFDDNIPYTILGVLCDFLEQEAENARRDKSTQ